MFRETGMITIAERTRNGLFYDISYTRFLLLSSGFTKKDPSLIAVELLSL